MAFLPRPPLQPLPIAWGPPFGARPGFPVPCYPGMATWAPGSPFASPQLPTSGGAARAQPCQMTPVQMQDLNTSLREEVKAKPLCARPSAKKGHKERQYTIDDLKGMAAAVLSGTKPSARVAAISAGLPSAERSLNRYLKGLREKCGADTTTSVAEQLELVEAMEFKDKGNVDLCVRRLFTEDELDYFARAIKLYSEMGWPLDYQQIRCMFSHAAANMNKMAWKPGEPYVCSTSYVARFVQMRPELRAFKASHVDPLRAKKASAEVRDQFFDLFERMVSTLYARGQDPDDPLVPASFAWKTPEEIPGA
ncbi:hypothetical protein AB1Y20_020338 [Prymnesium parvum]|uniref:HTH CENPB-type domain-containing protein n=1 Tax=Prymnesium parvum TaxID=97485 RepID=A0AB34JXC1_PRYPA